MREGENFNEPQLAYHLGFIKLTLKFSSPCFFSWFALHLQAVLQKQSWRVKEEDERKVEENQFACTGENMLQSGVNNVLFFLQKKITNFQWDEEKNSKNVSIN